MNKNRFLIFVLALLLVSSASASTQIQLWHQMIYSHREVLKDVVKKFEEANPEIKVHVIYRETEELRSAFQSSAMAGSGPELIFGPSDQVGPFATMGLIRDLNSVYNESEKEEFDILARISLNDKLYMIGNSVGNFLMLIYNKDIIKTPPKTLDELIKIGMEQTRDLNGDGKIDNYGLVFNYTEPYFFVPWIDGYGEHFISKNGVPNLDNPAMISALNLMKDFKEKYKIIPVECDYEGANALFKENRAAMIINGDWSWGDYKEAGINFGIAKFPTINETGLNPAPLVGTTGYSLNINIKDPEKEAASIKLLKYLTSKEAQIYFTQKINTYPSRHEVRLIPEVSNNEILKEAANIMSYGQPMPIVSEVRAVWDALRGQYQSVLAGNTTANDAAKAAQLGALKQIDQMNEVLKKDSSIYVIYFIVIVALILVLYYILKNFVGFFAELRGRNKFAYYMMLPSFIGIFSVVLFPFFYNIALSVSNFSLRTFSNWEIVGFAHYYNVLVDPKFYEIFAKTILWTVSNVFFHVSIGVLLAVIIEQVMPKKNLWRTILIIPWAIPQYITALTWRGMFNQEYGPINIFLQEYLHLSPVQWLSQPWTTFSACVVTNIWLGFPFMMIVALGGLQSIPKSIYESAKLDGANAFDRFWHITWPLLQPVIRPAALLGSIWTFNTLNVIWLVSNSGEPADQTHILVSYVYKAAFNLYRYGYASALSMIIFIILVVMSLIVGKINEKQHKV